MSKTRFIKLSLESKEFVWIFKGSHEDLAQMIMEAMDEPTLSRAIVTGVRAWAEVNKLKETEVN